jgi:hypothetical protein
MPSQRERRWTYVRLALGILQIAGAGFSLALLIEKGVTVLSAASVLATGIFTGISLMLFGGKKSNVPINHFRRRKQR